MPAFEDALGWTLKFEGGKVDNPHDRGGRTAFGITQATYDRFRLTGSHDVWDITPSEVQAIYRTLYWDAVSGDKLAEVNSAMSLCVFDTAVNSGTGTAARTFQRTVQVEPDGVIGKVTLACYRIRRRNLGDAQLLEIFMERRAGIYKGILLRDPSQSVFRNGWRNRIVALCEHVGINSTWE